MGICIVEVIMTVAILGIVITPLMSMFIVSQKINSHSEIEYKTMLLAQNYMEEVKASKVFDDKEYIYNNDKNCFERLITGEGDMITKISVWPLNGIAYNIEVEVSHNGKVINRLVGSKLALRMTE